MGGEFGSLVKEQDRQSLVAITGRERRRREPGTEGAYLYEVGEVAGAIFDHQTVDNSFEVGLAVVVGE